MKPKFENISLNYFHKKDQPKSVIIKKKKKIINAPELLIFWRILVKPKKSVIKIEFSAQKLVLEHRINLKTGTTDLRH